MTTGRCHARGGSRRAARVVAAGELAGQSRALLDEGHRLALVACHDDGDALRCVYLFLAAAPERRVELHVHLDPVRPEVPTLAGLSFPAGRFEREMHDLFGVVPVGHPLPRRLVRHPNWPAGWYPMRRDAGDPPPFALDSEPYPFLEVEGTGVYEIPVGPIHAGIIEPGHFRFSVVGETILKLKARLWFVHRGVERCFEGRHAEDGIELAERISGDTAAAHSLAYALAVEDASSWDVGEDAQRLRALVVELERITNHVADLGALANDAGYSVLNGHALALRERMLRMNEQVTGHRLLRGAIAPGGVRLRALPDLAELDAIAAGAAEVARNALRNTTVRDRFTGTAVLSADDAAALGCLGVVARASGVPGDARVEHPVCELPVATVVHTGGDVLSRFLVRRDEVAASVELVRELCARAGGRTAHTTDAPGDAAAPAGGTGVVEGWRGTIVHRVELAGGRLTRVKVVDPSWFNWPALPVALVNTIVPDFPLANKSFNLSYAGNDL
ncbi:MAG TPA: NADH-quinone oxidoreductase subunit C [Acidimicrobiales bacterium]|nr:NADH-quinone oxidoreductase subunit C [Acidimicrobiales bacterium]